MAIKNVKYTKHKIRWKMGKNLLRKIFAFVVMVMGAVTVFSACSKDPYKKMRLSLDKNEITITYDADDIEKNRFSISATVSGVGKKVSKDVEFVVGDNSIVSPIGSDYIRTSGDKTTATFVATPNGGTTYIDVMTLEGNKKQRVMVNVEIPIESMSFEMETLPIERGVKTDITSKFDGVSTQIYNRLSFVPENTTQNDVVLTVTDMSGEAFSDNEVTIDGNYITVNSETLSTFNLTATSKFDSDITASISCTVLDTIDTEKVVLKENDTTLQLTYESGKPVYVLNLANASSSADADKQKEVYVDFNMDNGVVPDETYVVGCVKADGIPFGVTDNQNSFVVWGGSGKSTGLVYFSLNYKGFEHLFAPKYVTLRVNVSTFPDEICFSDGQEQIESMKVYQNYGGAVLGASTILNILSRSSDGTTSPLSTQTAYLAVEASGYGAISGVNLWYYSKGVKYDINAKTAIRHGEKIYIGFDSDAISDFSNTIELVARSTVNDVEGRVTLDLVKGTVRPVFANGSVINMKEGVSESEPNTFVLSTTERDDGMPYLTLGSTDVALSECSVKLENNGGVVTCVYDEQQGGFLISAGKLPAGVTEMTVSGTITAPNGVSADFSVFVYENVNSDTLAFRIGNKNYTFSSINGVDSIPNDVEPYEITMSISGGFDIKLVKLLDFKTDDGGNVTTEYDPDGRYEVIETIPNNIVFEKITRDENGSKVVSVDFSNKLHIASGRSTGEDTISYVLSSTSYDPNLSDEKNYMYIAFKITVEAILNGFNISGSTIETESKDTFSIIADRSILHSDTNNLKTDKLRAIARPNNTVLNYENIKFEVKYEDKLAESEEPEEYTFDGAVGRLYSFNITSGQDKRIINFSIFVSIDLNEKNIVEMTFRCDNIEGMDSANVRVTLIYTQTFTDINGKAESYSERKTFDGVIRKAVKVTNIAFDRQEVMFNVNQFGIDASGKVQNTERAKTSVNYLVTPSANLTLKGFYLFYKIGDNDIQQAIGTDNEYNIDGFLNVVVGDGYVGLSITQYEDGKENIRLYLVPMDMSDETGRIEPSVVESSDIPASFTVSFRNGTKDNPYKIQDAYDLQFVNSQLDAYYELTNDILISNSTDWTPIGINADNQFVGNIKGNGYKISGLVLNKTVNIEDACMTDSTKQVVVGSETVNVQGYAAYYGLFGYIGMGAEISDIKFENFHVYVEYNGENLGVEIDENNTISSSGERIFVDVYIGGFAGFNLGTLTNITVVDDTERGYSSLKGNILNSLRVTDDDNNVVNKGIAYQPKNIYSIHSNSVFVGGMVGLNSGEICEGKVNVAMFVRDKQDHPTLQGISTAYVGGVSGVNLSTRLQNNETVYESGIISGIDVYSLINATLVDPVFKGMIRNDNSVLGGIVGLNISANGYAFVKDSTCQTIIVGKNYIGGAIGQNYGVLNNVEVIPHIYGIDYIGGAVGTNMNAFTGTYQVVNNNIKTALFAFGSKGLISVANDDYKKGIVYHTKVKFVDTVDEISLFNTSIIGRNYVGGLIGYTYDSNAEKVNLQNTNYLQRASQYDFTSIANTTYATVAYSSVKSYFTRGVTNVNDYETEVQYLNQLYMDFTYKDDNGNVIFDKTIFANAESKYYGDIVVLAPISSDVNNTYIGGLIGYSDGGVSTSGKEVTAGTGGNYIHVYFDAVVSNTYNVDSETDTAIIGGLIGKANGILFVYNANILGRVENAKCVGGFVGDSSELLDRLGLEDKKPYSKRDNFYEKSTTYNYSGKFNINNSYTTLKIGDNYVQNFAYIGERVNNKINSGDNDNSQVNTIRYNTGGSGYRLSGDKNYYYPQRKVNRVTIKEYKDSEVKETSSTRRVEYRKILKYVGNTTDKIAIQNGYKDKVSAPTYVTEGEEGYKEAGIFQSNGTKTYYSLTTSRDENDVVTNTWTPSPIVEYVKLYCEDDATVPTYYKKDDLTYNSDDGIYLYDENGVAKYKKTNYYIMTSNATYNYYVEQVDDSEIENTNPLEVIVYTCTPAYVEVEPNYVSATLTVYNNGVQNNGADFYWYNSYIYNSTSNTIALNNDTYTIYEKGEYKTEYELAKTSTYSEYVVGDTVYANIIVDPAGSSNRQIKFYTTADDTEPNTIDYNDKNMYHKMLDYVVNGTTLNNVTSEIGQAEVEFSYNRLTASNSFYVGFETYLYDQDGNVLEENDVAKKVEFTENDAKNTTLGLEGNYYSYYPTTWHYTNINYSDLIFKKYASLSSLAGYHIQYEDSDDLECVIAEYAENEVLINGEGFVNPKTYISEYDLNTYAYSMYEGGGNNGLVSGQSTEGNYIYHNREVNGGLPLAFGKYQGENETKLNLIIDIAPESLNIGNANGDYRVDNVSKNEDGSLVNDNTMGHLVAVILDYDESNENKYDFIGGVNNVIDVNLLPQFVGYGNLKIVSSDSSVVEVVVGGDNYSLLAKGVGCAIINIASTLNNSLSCDIVVLVKETTTALNYTYLTSNGVKVLQDNASISILKNNSSIFGITAKNNSKDVVLKNFGVEYTINSGSAIINGKNYTAGSTVYVYGVSNSFKVDEEYEITARPFYLYEVTYNGNTYAYRKYVDALTGKSEVDTESITYTVSPNSFAYNITAPGNIQAGIANQTSFEIQVKSNDSTLVPFNICFGEKDTNGEDKYYVVETTLDGGVYESLFKIGDGENDKKDSITVNKLNITLVKTTYSEIRNIHTIKFVLDVDSNDYNSFSNETEFEISCKINGSYIADNNDKSDKFTFTLLPFQVENVRMSHYTKFWYDNSSDDADNNYETTYKSYKYASNKIIPGYNSLLQVNITPSYGKFDYVIAEIVGTDGSIIRQVVESENSLNNSQGVSAYYDFPYFEQVNNASNKIKVTNKYSYFKDTSRTYDPSLMLGDDRDDYFKWDESGTLLFALNLDSKYVNSTVSISVKGYSIESSGDTLQFEQSITLDVVELPRLSVTWDRTSNEFSKGNTTNATLNIGGSLDINIDTNDTQIECNPAIGKVEYQNGKYVFSLTDKLTTKDANGAMVPIGLNTDYAITFTATKIVDGAKYSTQATIYVRPVLFLVSGVSFLGSDGKAISDSMNVYYNEEKDIKVQINAEYDITALENFDSTYTKEAIEDNIQTELNRLAQQVWNTATENDNDSYTSSYFWKNEIGNKDQSNALTTGDYSRRGYILKYLGTDTDACFKIRIASSSVKDNIVVAVNYDYTSSGVAIYPSGDGLTKYAGMVQKTLSFNVHASSRDENPLPIKSVDDFKNMVAGESYILLNDLVLSKWEPIEALFRSFDGNGYTITITSFGNVSGLTDIGLFSTIGTDDSDLGYYTTIENLYIDICPITEGESGMLYMDETATLEVNIGSTEDVNVGVLAGTNYGVITNVNVTNNASHIRASRKASLSGYSPIIVEDFSKYFYSDPDTDIEDDYKNALAGSKTINIDSDNMVDTFSIVTSETKESQGLYVGGLVGLNSASGYITNSSVEGVNVKGMDYVAGFASRNLGYISSSYFKGGSVISNDKQTKANSATAGFVAKNESGKIQFSYVLGAETGDVYNKNTTDDNINSMSTYIHSDSNSDMLVLNSNSPEYSASDKRTGKIQINLTDYAGYAIYKQYKEDGTNKDIANLRALGSAVYTNNYASGFVGENSAYISNCYANILVSGTYSAGFAYENEGKIESSYSMSSIKNNNENYYPFIQSKTDVDKCFYLYVNASDGINVDSLKDGFSKYNEDVATSLYAAAFGDYNTFTSWGFNSDYSQNNKLEDGVWFIPAKSDNVKSTSVGMQTYLRESSYTSLRPELVSANIFTMSLRYYVTGDNGNYSYTNVDNWVVENRSSLNISQGSLNNPLLITTASDFNTNLSPAKDDNGNNTPNCSIVRMVHDIEFHEVQTATTFTTDFKGNLEGNGLSINKLRIVADASSTNDKVTYLGLFRSIQSGTVRNLNINIEEISGSNINFVGVLAGAIDNGKVYNIKISSTYDDVRVEGLNAVGGLAGMIVGASDIVNITNNISVKANARYQLNIFSPYNPNVQNTQFKMFVPNDDTQKPFEDTNVTTTYSGGKTKSDNIADAIKDISYVGGIAGIIDVTANLKNSRLDYTDRIRQCYVNESVILTGDVVGGLAGYVGQNSSLSNSEFVICENTTLNALRVGGAIVGHNEGKLNRVVVKYDNQKQVDANFYNAENNTQNNSSYYNALDNARSDSAYTLNIRSDVFSGNAHYIGGIIGANFGGTLKNSYSRLNVVNIYSAYAGGLIGLNIGGELDSVYTTGSVKGYFATGGIIGIQPKVLSIEKEKNGTTVTYYYLDDQSTAVNNDYARRYINNISNVLNGLSLYKTESTTITTESTTYSNVVGANIWRYSDTSVYRSEYYSTQRDSYIGVFVGFMSDNTLIKQNAISSRLAIENTFFKQTYVYNTNSNALISEIGNIDLAIGESYSEDNTYTDIVSDKENDLQNLTIFSLNYTVDEITYAVSRMQYYGSLRSLNEIVSRTYSVSDEASIWRHMTGKTDYNESLFNRSGVKQISIYFGFDTFNWNGTQIDSETNLIVNEVSGVRDVFPEIVNNLKPKIINVKTEDDLRKMSTYLDSKFILQNDITLSLAWMPVGTEDKPFTGELCSAEGQCYSIKNVSMTDGDNDYFGFIRVANGASLHDFKLECTDVLNNDANSTKSNNDSTSIAGGILVGLADKDEDDENTTIENVNIRLNTDKNVKIFSTQYVGGVVGYGKGLSLSDVTLEKYENSTTATQSSTSVNAKFFTSMYKTEYQAGTETVINISYAFGGLVGRFDKDDTQTSTSTDTPADETTSAENITTLSDETTSAETTSTLSVNNIDFYVNYLDETTISTLVTTENRKFDESKVYVGGVLGWTETTPTWEISTSGVSITANMPDDTTYGLYIGGAVGGSNGVNYTSDIEVNTNITATLNNNSTNNPAGIGGVFGRIGNAEVASIVNNTKNTITLNITNANNKVYVGGVVGYASSTTFDSADSNTASSITIPDDTTTVVSNIRAGGFVGFAENSEINNVNVGSAEITNGILTSKIDLIILKDNNGGNKSIFLGGIAGFVSNTAVSTSNVLGNINHTFDEGGRTAEYSKGNTYEAYIGGAIGYTMDGGTLDQVSADQVSADVNIIDNRFEKNDGTFNYGGLVGYADAYNITDSYAVGKIYSVQHIKYLGYITSDESNGTYLGGLVGNGNGITFENCYSATQFVLPNSDTNDTQQLMKYYSQSFWENTNKGGIIGHASGTCTSTNVYYVKDFVPFSNGLCGTGVRAEALKNEFNAGLSDEKQKWKANTDNFYPLLNSASGKVTNTQGSGQNPYIMKDAGGYNSLNHKITSAQTVYINYGNNKWSTESITIDTFGTMVIVGQNRLILTDDNIVITNKGTMFGGEIQEDTILNKGSIIGVKSVGCAAVEPQTVYWVSNKGFIYASGVFELKDANTGLIVNSIYKYSEGQYFGNNLNISGTYTYYTGSTKSAQKTGLSAQNVENFDFTDTSLDLDIDKYWSRVHDVNRGMFVPKWLYKNRYYDDDYSSTYGWYASADSRGVDENGTTYTVSSAAGLAYIAKLVNTSESTTSINILLNADIDLAGKVWTPIGTLDHPFTGTFDGNGHTISNMLVVGNTYNGLFGVVKNATIKNVLIKDAQVASSGSNDCTAILVGQAKGTIKRGHTIKIEKGTLKIEKVAIEDAHICAGNNNVAGIVGYLDNSTLTVDHAYVIIAVNTNRSVYDFSFVVNKRVKSDDTITINNVYGANIGVVTASDETKSYDIVSQGQVLGSQTQSYGISNVTLSNEDDSISKAYVLCEPVKKGDTTYNMYASPMFGVTAFKTKDDLRTKVDLFDEWNTTWTRESTKNYNGFPILNFSQEYWIDEGAKSTSAVTASENIYEITSASQLAWVAYQVNTGANDFSGKTIRVTENIDLAGKIWTPIGITGHAFKGSFVLEIDESISNMTCYGAYSIENSSNTASTVSTETESTSNTTTLNSRAYDFTYGGLFGLVEDSPSMVIDGSIKNFIVGSVKYGATFIAEYKGTNLTSAPTIKVASIGSSDDGSLKDTVSASDYAGGVVGKITGTSSAKVDVVGNVVKASISSNYAGGIVGYAQYVTIRNSSVSGASITGTENTGGIAGQARYSTLFNCKAENFTMTSTSTDSSIGGIVGRAYGSKMSALAVTNMTAKNITATSFGGVVGSVTSSTIQNVTVKDSNTALSHILDVKNYGGVVGSMYVTHLSEVAVIGKAEIKDNHVSFININTRSTYGFVVGLVNDVKDYYESGTYIVDNIYLDISYNRDFSGLLTYNLYKYYVFGFGDQTPSVDVFSYTMFSMKNEYYENGSKKINYLTYGDCASSSAWTYDENHYVLKANGKTLCSNYRMANADNLTAISDNVETVDGHVVITPYKLESVNVSTSGGMQYLAEWWIYRHKKSDNDTINDTTINISANIEDYSAGSIGNKQFPFVGTLNGNSKTITFSSNITSQGIIGYATKINAKNITLAQSDEKSQGYGISGSDNYVGGLVGHIVGNGDSMTIENIISYIKVSGKDYVGGIIGAVELTNGSTLSMIKCRSLEYVDTDGYILNGDSSPVSGANYVGGIIGSVNMSTTATGKVTIDGKTKRINIRPVVYAKSVLQKDIEATGDYVGSIVGYGKNVTIQYYIIRPLKDNNNWLTMVKGPSTEQKYYGGVAGYITDSKISNTGLDSISVVAVKSNYVGGVAGYATSSTISSVTVKAEQDKSASITGNLNVGGLVGGGEYKYDTSGNPTTTCLELSSNTIESVNVGGYGSVGGLIGYLTATHDFDSCANTITIDIKNISGNTVENSIVKLLEKSKEDSDHDYVGGLIGKLYAANYYAGYYACFNCGALYNESLNTFANLYGNTCVLHIAKPKTLTPTFTTTTTAKNTIKDTTIIYTANVDNNEGWFGEYDSSNSGVNGSTTAVKTRVLADNNRWANTSYAKSLRFSEVRYMAMGNSAKNLAKSGDSWYLSTWFSHTSYSGYGISFNYKDVSGKNTWFGPTAGDNNSQNIKDITLSSTSCIYLSTFGNSSSITTYGGSISVPDLTNIKDTEGVSNIAKFFRSARGYNTSKMPHVGTLYGTNNITDNKTTLGSNVKIKSSSKDNNYRVLYDRFTHWAYIAMQDDNLNSCYGALVIEWSYYIDSDQRVPKTYSFINDVQKDFATKENERIDVKYTYDIQKSYTNKFNLDWSKASSVSEQLRSLRDLFSRSTAQGGASYKGLINEFVMAVYKKDTTYKSLFCGNEWKAQDEFGSSSSTTSIETYDIYEDTGAYYLYIQTAGGTKYYRYSNNNISNNDFDPTSDWYYGMTFGGERRLIKQKSRMAKN